MIRLVTSVEEMLKVFSPSLEFCHFFSDGRFVFRLYNEVLVLSSVFTGKCLWGEGASPTPNSPPFSSGLMTGHGGVICIYIYTYVRPDPTGWMQTMRFINFFICKKSEQFSCIEI